MDFICLMIWVTILIGVIVQILRDRDPYDILGIGAAIVVIIHYAEKCFGM